MHEKNISGKDISKAITSEDLLGKEVIDAEGGVIGVAEKIFIDPISLDFVGISIDKGLIRNGLSIGKNYISKITEHAIFLKIKVAYDIKGMTVFDKDGKKVGIVRSIDLQGNKNKIKSIYVKTNFSLSIFKKEVNIPSSHIKNIGDNVILNVTRKMLLKSEK